MVAPAEAVKQHPGNIPTVDADTKPGITTKVYNFAVWIITSITPNCVQRKAAYAGECFHYYRKEENRNLFAAIIWAAYEVFMSIFRGEKIGTKQPAEPVKKAISEDVPSQPSLNPTEVAETLAAQPSPTDDTHPAAELKTMPLPNHADNHLASEPAASTNESQPNVEPSTPEASAPPPAPAPMPENWSPTKSTAAKPKSTPATPAPAAANSKPQNAFQAELVAKLAKRQAAADTSYIA